MSKVFHYTCCKIQLNYFYNYHLNNIIISTCGACVGEWVYVCDVCLVSGGRLSEWSY